MASGEIERVIATTYVYEPLHSRRHIRLLQINDADENSPGSTFALVQFELPIEDEPTEFECLSYQWGDPARISSLEICDAEGNIGLTANLTEALPFVAKNLRGKSLWIGIAHLS
jgi:hypothetical protein